MDDEIPLQRGSHASSSHEASLEPIEMRREELGKHNVHIHFPKDRNCEICKRTRITKAPCRRRKGEAVPRADNFGDLITADHKVLSDHCESRNNHRYAVVVQDLATQWIQAYPCKNKLHNVLEEHGGKESFPNHQSNTDTFFSNLLLQPNTLSIDHQTKLVFVNDDFEDRILSCKIQLLHRLPSVTSHYVEED